MTRVLLLGFALLAVACGGHNPGSSVCDNQVPPPAACKTACDPSPTAANTCPLGYHCTPDGTCDALCTPTGNQCGDGYTCTSEGFCDNGNGCTGLACNITLCDKMGMPPTTISGTVFAPNGTLPLYGVSVYVPNRDPGPFTPGVSCGSCAAGLPGEPIAQAVTDENGNFTIPNVPNGANIPLVITIGKWRRQIKIPSVAACATQMLAATETTLPKSHDDMTPNTTSVDLPQIAISTGQADSLECLVRRLGIADKEITTDGGAGKIHLFADTKATTNGNGFGTISFDNGFAGGTGTFKDSQTLWGTAADPGKLNNYDIVILSCEGDQHPETKPQVAMDHLKAYADLGGRVFLSHWHNIWLEGSTQHTGISTAKPDVWAPDPTKPGSGIATFVNNVDTGTGTVDTIDEVGNPKGVAFANWMLKVGSTGIKRDQVPIIDGTGKHTATSIIGGKAERWVYWQSGTNQFPQNFQFTTPNEVANDQRCGKVVFSDMHVSGNGASGGSYPSSCGTTTTLSDQEKALAFMFFDISSCVGVLQ
jgi:hypothetical protein